MKIAVEGCCHGELDKIYDTVKQLEIQNGFKIDLLIICGDFQAVRNMDDLQAMAVPPKYQKLNTFYKYYSGEKVAPVLTIFIGGNHEASNYLQELPYGGWVAKNIYYLGYAGIVQVGGVRIGGISGIYKGHDFNKGHFESPPYDESCKRSVYHVRNIEVFRLKQVSRHVDIFISHDWPTGIYNYGDMSSLIKFKPFLKKEVEDNSLGSKPCADLLTYLKPSYWFAAHLHVKFAAYVEHSQGDDEDVKSTKFLALDKCLPRRRFLQVLDVPHDDKEGLVIKLDPEWLRILQSTNHLMITSQRTRFMPGPGGSERYDFTVTDSELDGVRELFGGDMTLPENFVTTAPTFTGNPHNTRARRNPLFVRVNPQTTLLCTMLEITDPNAKLLGKTSEEILDESDIGLPAKDEDDVDDDIDDGDGDADTTCNPSFINSSLELSQSSSFSSNISGSWDGLIGNKKVEEPTSSTQSSANIQVADDDEELLSILSVQKSKSLPHPNLSSHNNQSSSSSPSSSSSTSLSRAATVPAISSSHDKVDQHISQSDNVNKTKKLSVAERLKSLKTIENQQRIPSSLSDCPLESCDSQDTVILARTDTLDRLGVESCPELSESCSTSSDRRRDISSNRSTSPDCSDGSQRLYSNSLSLSNQESSGVCSVSSTSSVIGANVSPPTKRDSSDLDSTEGSQGDGSQVTSSGGSMKKLKRRNVSMYQETSD